MQSNLNALVGSAAVTVADQARSINAIAEQLEQIVAASPIPAAVVRLATAAEAVKVHLSGGHCDVAGVVKDLAGFLGEWNNAFHDVPALPVPAATALPAPPLTEDGFDVTSPAVYPPLEPGEAEHLEEARGLADAALAAQRNDPDVLAEQERQYPETEADDTTPEQEAELMRLAAASFNDPNADERVREVSRELLGIEQPADNVVSTVAANGPTPETAEPAPAPKKRARKSRKS